MDFENLIWIIAVMIYVASVILKKKQVAPRPKTPDKPQKGPEWKEKLDRYLAQITGEIKTEMEGATAEKEIRREETAAPAVIVDGRKTRLEREAFIKDIEPAMDDRSPEAAAGKPEMDFKKAVRDKGVPKFVIEDLQKAIIWSEILGPPVALKNHRK